MTSDDITPITDDITMYILGEQGALRGRGREQGGIWQTTSDDITTTSDDITRPLPRIRLCRAKGIEKSIENYKHRGSDIAIWGRGEALTLTRERGAGGWSSFLL